MSEAIDRLRAEIELARSYYKDNQDYVNAIEKFAEQLEGKTEIIDNNGLCIFAGFLNDYIKQGFRFSPINLLDDSWYTMDGERFICNRCKELIRFTDKNGNKKLINLRPYKILVTNEYVINNSQFIKRTNPTSRFNGDHIPLFINKGGIINKEYIVIDNFRKYPSESYLEPELIRKEIPVTMIHNLVKNKIIFAVDHKSRALKELLDIYDYHYEENQDVYYNIRNKLYK